MTDVMVGERVLATVYPEHYRQRHVSAEAILRSYAEAEASARLITAAPDMAEALKAAVHALRSYQYGNAATELAKDVADRCEAILAKARGEQ